MNSYLQLSFLKRLLILVSAFMIVSQTVNAQVILYLEDMKSEKPIKYYEGQMLSFKAAPYPKEWQNIKIGKIFDQEKMITYQGGVLYLKDIIRVRRQRSWAVVTGTMLQTFGLAWFGFGGIAHFATDSFEFGVDTALIGGTAIFSGWILKKLFKYKKYRIGKKNRLKILDLSWPEPTNK